MYGDQRTGAGCIYRYRGPLKIEAVGDPRRSNGLGISPEGLRRRVFRGKPVVVGTSTTDVDSALLLMHALAGVPCIFQRSPGFLQEQALLRIHVSRFHGRDPEERRIKLIDGVGKTTAAAIPIAAGGLGHPTIGRPPPRHSCAEILSLREMLSKCIQGL